MQNNTKWKSLSSNKRMNELTQAGKKLAGNKIMTNENTNQTVQMLVNELNRQQNAKFDIVAAHPPSSYSTIWDEYQACMQGLERQLLEEGAKL